MNCNCLNGLGNPQLAPENIVYVAQKFATINPFEDRIRDIEEDYNLEVALAVKYFYETGTFKNNNVPATPNQPNKKVLSPSELKQLFIDLKLDINKEENRRQAMQAIAARSDIDFDATLQILNTIPFLNNGGTNTPSTESNSGLLLKALLGFAVGYGIKKIFFSDKKPVKTAFAGVKAKRKVEIVQF